MTKLNPKTGYPYGYEPSWWKCQECGEQWHDSSDQWIPCVAWGVDPECGQCGNRTMVKLACTEEISKPLLTRESFKCEACNDGAVVTSNDGIHLCQDCYDERIGEAAVLKDRAHRDKAFRADLKAWLVTTACVVTAASLLGLVIYKESEKAPFMKVEKLIELKDK